jgi:hypothetical protein
MKTRTTSGTFGTLAVAMAVLAFGCTSPQQDSKTTNQKAHTYNGTAAVGDFLTITVDRGARTMSFRNWTTGNSGVLSFVEDADGTLVVTDADPEIVKANEIPGFALVAEDRKAKDGKQQALVFAFEQVPAQVSDFRNLSLASIEFRTSNGGTELFCASLDPSGAFTGAGYIPLDQQFWPPGFNAKSGTFDASADTTVTGALLLAGKPGEPPVRLFKTSSGAWVGDGPGGSGLWFPSSPTSAFDAGAAGTYFMQGYSKTGEGPSDTGITGAPAFFSEVVTLSASGALSDGTNTVQLEPLRAKYPGTLVDIDACNGLFAFTPPEGGEGFAFVHRDAIYFSQFRVTNAASRLYDYQYGVALRRPPVLPVRTTSGATLDLANTAWTTCDADYPAAGKSYGHLWAFGDRNATISHDVYTSATNCTGPTDVPSHFETTMTLGTGSNRTVGWESPPPTGYPASVVATGVEFTVGTSSVKGVALVDDAKSPPVLFISNPGDAPPPVDASGYPTVLPNFASKKR